MRSEEVVLVWAPRGRDAPLAIRLLAHHRVHARECAELADLIAGITTAGCAIIAAEALTVDARDAIAEALARQPPWSDFPVLLFAPRGTDLADRSIEEAKSLGNVAILERPVHPSTLVSAVVAALRGRRRQYEAREAIHRRDQFLAMLGHELRNPLGAIVLALETMPRVPEQARSREIMERQARHLARLVEDLLDVARVTSGKVRLEKAPIDLALVVQRCLSSAELSAADRGITLAYAGPAEPLVIEGDLVRLEEVFHNLVGNAIKYSPPRTRVELRARCDANSCIVEVIDQGVGIAPDMLPRVFDLFAQAEDTLDRSKGGLGIGLTLVRSIIDLHGGSISASSPGLGRGSTFTVRLPRSAASLRDSRPMAVAIEPRPLRVVVVEDNVDVLAMTRDMLEHYGCEVATAPDGTSGLELLLAERPDIAFVDIGLPGIDGFRIAEQARARNLDETYLVAMSGYGQPEDRRRALAAGFDRHLTKPVTAAALQEAMGTVRVR